MLVVENVDPVYARPTIDLSANEPEQPARLGVFPAGFDLPANHSGAFQAENFPPEEADSLKAMAHASGVELPGRLVKRFCSAAICPSHVNAFSAW